VHSAKMRPPLAWLPVVMWRVSREATAQDMPALPQPLLQALLARRVPVQQPPTQAAGAGGWVVSLTPLPQGRIRKVVRDGADVWKLQCPECGQWADIDDDQLHGLVSVDHSDAPPCTFHEARDWYLTAELYTEGRGA